MNKILIKTKKKNKLVKDFMVPPENELKQYNEIIFRYNLDDCYPSTKKYNKSWILWDIEILVDPTGYDIWIKASDNFYSYKHAKNYNELVDFINETNKLLEV